MRRIAFLVLFSGLAACSDPLAGVDRLSELDVAPADAAAAALPDAAEIEREGFFGTSATAGDSAAPERGAPAARRGGFFGALLGGAGRADGTGTEVAAIVPDNRGDAAAARPGRAEGVGPVARDVPFGTVLPFGEIARVCEARGKNLGRKVGQTFRRGFALHDSVPGLLAKRTYYITGFDDNCPRQFTAANALLGTPSTYEGFRFSPAGKHMPYAATDAAYDRIKSRTCGARKSKPCGRKIGRLDKTTGFLSAYEFNEHNGRWKEFLVHDGAVVAAAVKTLN